MSGGEAAEEESEECCDATVENCHPDQSDSAGGSLLTSSFRGEEGVSNVDSVVNTETYGQDYVDSGENVNSNAPEVEETHNVHQSDDDHAQHQEDHEDVAQEEHGDDGHTEDGEEQVPHKLESNNFISFPGRVDLGVREEVRRVG